jgi:hypothetical protein
MGSSAACCEGGSMSLVMDEIKQLCPSTKAENLVRVCMNFLFPWFFFYFLRFLVLFQVRVVAFHARDEFLKTSHNSRRIFAWE